MAKYFMMQVDSLVRTFSVMDTGRIIQFGMEIQDREGMLEEPEAGDWILGYVPAPVGQVRLVFQVSGKDGPDRLELVKKLEVEDGVQIGDPQLEEWVSRQELCGLEEERFREICQRLVEGQRLALAAGGGEETGKDPNPLETASGVTAPRLPVPWNYLVFGAPGTGKSYLVARMQKQYFPEQDSFERVTFYANYSYANFVGTYKPRMHGKEIGYEFVPGPLIRVLEKAVKNPDRNFLLIVEEINRANAAAVFGDVFQLLDRKKGTSEYPIETSEDLKQYLASGYYGDFAEREDLKARYLDSFGKLLLPSNLYIWATMNSADQGVFPMDTAFKRRWDFRYVGVDECENQVESVRFLAPSGEEAADRVSWNRLRKAVNARLSRECRVNEDKLLGPFFLSGELLERDETGMILDQDGFLEAFKSKILMYLFEDAARQRRPQIFPGCEDCSRYSAVCEAFDRIGIRIFGEQVYGEAVERSGSRSDGPGNPLG